MHTFATRMNDNSRHTAWRRHARLSDVLAALAFAAAMVFSAAIVLGLVG